MTQVLWDISSFVDAASAVLPGDTAYQQQAHFISAPGCLVNISRITLSPDTGADADASPVRAVLRALT